jgi:HrpA-like RNA helicase
MSATLNADLFARYFGGAKTMTIPGFAHPVKDLCDELLCYLVPSGEPDPLLSS